MSSRHIRRLSALNKQREPEESEEEEEPHENYVSPSLTFQGLEVSSDSETEQSAPDESLDPEVPSPSTSSKPGPSSSKSATVQGKDKSRAKKGTNTEAELAKKAAKKARQKSKKDKQRKKSEENEDLDWLVEEINQKLGVPQVKRQEVVIDWRKQRKSKLFYIDPNHLNICHELSKVYGTEMKSPCPPNRRQSHWIGVSPKIQGIQIKGIIMTCYQTEGRKKYFRFTHNQEYRLRCMEVVKEVRARLFGGDARGNMLFAMTCAEAYIENFDILFSAEEHQDARTTLEQLLFCMQYVAEPTFNYVDGNTRLLYEFIENRAFLIALLKYVHVLSNTACHITALAICKALYNLDHSDPLAVVLIIDTLAIRAREFQWLIDLIEAWRLSRDVHSLYNIRYSLALAMFHVARRKQNRDCTLEDADKALSKAILWYPSVAMKIIELAKITVSDDIKNHELFNPAANYPVPTEQLQQLINFYAWLIAPRWREPHVTKWFIKVLTDTVTLYNVSAEVREKALKNARSVKDTYRLQPTQIRRHLYVIRSMSKYIGDGHMPILEDTVSFNPYPYEGRCFDTYEYFREWALLYEAPSNVLLQFIEHIYPDYNQFG